MIRLAILIDGGHLRVLARQDNRVYNVDLVDKIAKSAVQADERLHRVLYYDCAPDSGKTKLPVSGTAYEFVGGDGWLRQLAAKDLFAVRRGVLKFRGWKPKSLPVAPRSLTDADFKPDFEQKGVDMRIGLDMATYCRSKAVERLLLITNDTDCIPAMKYARISGLQIALATFPNRRPASELLWHSDFERQMTWPK